MRKFLVAGCLAVGLIVSGVGIQSVRADHGHRGYPSHHGHYGNYGNPGCNTGVGRAYGPSGFGYSSRYRAPAIAIVPGYSAGYGAYPFGGNPYGNVGFGGVSNFYGGSPLGGYGYPNRAPGFQLRIGF